MPTHRISKAHSLMISFKSRLVETKFNLDRAIQLMFEELTYWIKSSIQANKTQPEVINKQRNSILTILDSSQSKLLELINKYHNEA